MPGVTSIPTSRLDGFKKASKIGPQFNSALNPEVRSFRDKYAKRENFGPAGRMGSAEVCAEKPMNVALFVGLTARRRISRPGQLAERVGFELRVRKPITGSITFGERTTD